VFGKHTDYAGGRSLVAAVPKGITVSAERTLNARIVVEAMLTGERAEFSSHGEGPDDGWRAYARVVIRRLAKNFPRHTLSARLAFESDLPQAAGLSSSSALIIAIAESLIACSGIGGSPEWDDAITSLEDRAGYFGCIENGADFRAFEGHQGIGTHGGSEDHAAIVLSEDGRLRAFSYAPIDLLETVTMPGAWTFVIATTGVAARKAGELRSAYNRLADEATRLLESWRQDHPHDPRTLGRLAREQALSGWTPPGPLRARLQQFIAEDARVAGAAAAFARADVAALGELAAASQADADRVLGNQIEETRALVTIARALGAAAATAFGAGWGGSVWALVERADASAIARRWLDEYRRRYPDHPSTAFVSPPSAGAHRIDAT
jgi:galactokinase